MVLIIEVFELIPPPEESQIQNFDNSKRLELFQKRGLKGRGVMGMGPEGQGARGPEGPGGREGREPGGGAPNSKILIIQTSLNVCLHCFSNSNILDLLIFDSMWQCQIWGQHD